jgi:basic membrane lipoprotein Med (substrate-binding protein (PBP1-ABC) superfamily)
MRATPVVRAFAVTGWAVAFAVVCSVLVANSASAQAAEPIATPPPNQFPGVKTGLVRNELTPVSINDTVEAAARFAHREIGGRDEDDRRPGFTSVTRPTTPDVVLAARDLAEQGSNLIVISGGDGQGTVGFAGAYPETVFIDIDRPLPCVTNDGRSDPSGTCSGGASAIPFNHSSVEFEVDQAAYLAGIVAAAASRDDTLAIISGTPDCGECNLYADGFTLGAQSIKPEIVVRQAYLADEGEELGFGDPASAKTYAKAFIDVFQPDVVLPLAGLGSRGIIEAACEAGVYAVGTDYDVATAHPELAECILASATKDIALAVRESVFSFANGSLMPEWRLGLDDGGVGVTDEWTRIPGLPVDLTERFTQAEQAILTGQVDTCSVACTARGLPTDPVEPLEPVEPEQPEPSPLPLASPVE